MHIRLNFFRLLCYTWRPGGLASNFFKLFMVNNRTSLKWFQLCLLTHSTDMLLLLHPLDSWINSKKCYVLLGLICDIGLHLNCCAHCTGQLNKVLCVVGLICDIPIYFSCLLRHKFLFMYVVYKWLNTLLL